MQRITFFIAVAAAAAACSNRKEVETAKRSLYDIDFAIVYNAALEATRELYPKIDDVPGTGAVRTAWHQVQYANNQDDLANQRTVAQGQGMPTGTVTQAQAQAGVPTRLAYKRYFIRFDVIVTGGRPWRVKVVGHASEWEPGAALPVELFGPAKPHWLEGRTDALTLAIYKRIRPYAVPMKEKIEETRPEDTVKKTDPKQFKGVPEAAAGQLAQIKDALIKRDASALRAYLADDVVWSLGAPPGADVALATWQADTEALDAMAKLIGDGCGATDKKISCPAADPKVGAWQLQLEQRAGAWKVSSFVRAE
ncbi:MAG: hypothetical protein KF773_42845 [Deltaproteobacteria bacterium]|nr:hypothetical protein [Deltaproteobacteria bacterium]MCW5808649.1 hypothetical protein [Deltaproteobacteria bacterium]